MTNYVSLCMICKNEENNIGFLLDDVCPVLEDIVIVDTGSTDNTLTLLQDKQKQYSNIRIEHFQWVNHFSMARNYSFSLASPNADWIFWLDGDDRIDGNKLKYFKDHILDNPEVDTWLLDYIYSKLPNGTPRTILGRERFIRKSLKPKWIGAIHETVDIACMRQRYSKELQVVHNHNSKPIEPKRNLKILESEFKKNPNHVRTAYYYGKELFDHVETDKAVKVLEHYLKLPGKYYDNECNARSKLARAYLAEGRHRDAIKCIDEVYHLDFTRKRADFYFIYGQVEESLRNYEIAIEWYKRCLMTPPEGTRVLTMEYYTWHPRERLAECYKALGDWDNALKYAKEVVDILPGDQAHSDWYKGLKSNTLKIKGGHKLVTLEFGTQLRYDSYRIPDETLELISPQGSKIPCVIKNTPINYIPLADNSIDGVVLSEGYANHITIDEVIRILKPGGFLWAEKQIINHDSLGSLGTSLYLDKYTLGNHIKVDPNKPVIAYRRLLNTEFAPYRYRILNLIKSAIKNGHKVITEFLLKDFDIFVDLTLTDITKRKNKTYILEVTEKLPDYKSFGIDKADVINASSPALATYIQKKYPNKKVINVDDHYELPASGWL